MKITIRHLSLFYLSLVLSMVIGCGGSSSTNVTPPPAIGKAYVAGNFSSVMRFPAGGTGDLPPQITRQLLPEVLGNLAADVPHDRVVATATASAPGAITEVLFVDNASTTMQPVRAISGTATTLQVPVTVAVDSTNDLVYILDNSGLLVFGPASTISGNVAPSRTITAAFSLSALALDSANNRLFLAGPAGTINIFDNASTLNGAVVPNRVIAGAATQLAIPVLLVLDSSGRLIVVNRANGAPPVPFNILVFSNAGSANGNVAPAAVFTLSANQQPVGMAVSPAGELYVVDIGPSVNVYSNITTATGNLAPVRTISGPHTGLVPGLGTNGIALDPTR